MIKLFLLLLLLMSCEIKNDVSYTFFVAGHVYGKPGVDNIGMHPPLKKCFPEIKRNCDFGILTGDVVWRPSIKDWNEIIYDIDILNIPIHIAPGNHDMSNRDLYMKYFNAYYSFYMEDDLFLILDTTDITNTQIDWIKSELTQEYRYLFVMVHHVLWINNCDIIVNNIADYNIELERLLSIFTTVDKQVYIFAGDVGANPLSKNFHYLTLDNLHLISSGMGNGKEDNYLMVTVNKNAIINRILLKDN